MSVALLDVNLLLALVDTQHPHHDSAHRWFSLERKRGWATCPVTVNAFIRILGNPAYPTARCKPAEAASLLRALCSAPDHQWWSDGVSMLDQGVFRHDSITGHRQLTDVYLLGLAVSRHGRLATFDRSIPLHAVIGATAGSLVVLGGA